MLLFIFFATLCSYNFHSLINTIYPSTTERHAWNIRNKTLLIILMAASTIMIFVYTYALRKELIFIAAGAVLTFLYSAPNIPWRPFIFLRKIAFGKTIFLAAVWTYVTGLLPMLISNGELSSVHYYYLGTRLFLVYAICVLFDIKDKVEDRQKGIRALPTVLSDQWIRFIYYLSASFALTCNVMMLVKGMMRQVFIFNLIPIMICMFMYQYAIKTKQDMFYYVILDGLMMLSSILLFIYVISSTFVS